MDRLTTQYRLSSTLRALGVGTATAILLTQVWLLWPRLSQATRPNSALLVPVEMIIFVGIGTVLVYAALCSLLLIPTWWVLTRLGLANWMMAAVLGAGSALGCLFADSVMGRGVLFEDIAVGVIGSLSGLAAWFAGSPKAIGS